MKHEEIPYDPLDSISSWRAWQVLSVYFTVLLNRQLQRRWLLEQQCMQDRPVSQRFRPLLFLEPVPSLHRPIPHPILPSTEKYNPDNPDARQALITKVRLLRARVEKGKELAAEIQRRMQDPHIQFPTHFCHSCVVDGDAADVLLTTCGHRVCQTCFSFGCDADGVYECSICFVPTTVVARSPLSAVRSCSEQISRVSVRGQKGRGGDVLPFNAAVRTISQSLGSDKALGGALVTPIL
ncbi:hypothetical protein N7492_006922 [Penicillium capsulatum]|uniref:RING-type domain-containing protein n=1 Tax=Penicillium capsulatum TaxID=69766 RepID=A0A9W9I3Y4_9EURO|nr:hypothetical protein N7492_006922 [Penicillium capsulatum]KAJ6116754.1 hypothetical protein N7512_006479 [Penicillium capsulatum]